MLQKFHFVEQTSPCSPFPSHLALSSYIWLLIQCVKLTPKSKQGGHFSYRPFHFSFVTVPAILQKKVPSFRENSACLLWVLCERKLCGLDFYVRIPGEGKMLQITSINHFKQSSGNALMI